VQADIDCRMETTWHNNEDFLHWRPAWFAGFGHYDLNRTDQHRRYMGIFQAVLLVYVTQSSDKGGPSLKSRRK
jgi:hypothetical protein